MKSLIALLAICSVGLAGDVQAQARARVRVAMAMACAEELPAQVAPAPEPKSTEFNLSALKDAGQPAQAQSIATGRWLPVDV